MLVHVCLDVTMQSQGSGNTLPVSLVRKRVSSRIKKGSLLTIRMWAMDQTTEVSLPVTRIR